MFDDIRYVRRKLGTIEEKIRDNLVALSSMFDFRRQSPMIEQIEWKFQSKWSWVNK